MRSMRGLIIALAAGLTVGMVLVAMWSWQHADALPLVAAAQEQPVMRLAVRSGAVALVALAQLVALAVIVGNLYTPDRFTRLLRWTAALAFAVAACSAIVLGWAGR